MSWNLNTWGWYWGTNSCQAYDQPRPPLKCPLKWKIKDLTDKKWLFGYLFRMLLDTLEFSVNLIIDAHNFCICCCLIMDLYMMQWWKFTVIFFLPYWKASFSLQINAEFAICQYWLINFKNSNVHFLMIFHLIALKVWQLINACLYYREWLYWYQHL